MLMQERPSVLESILSLLAITVYSYNEINGINYIQRVSIRQTHINF